MDAYASSAAATFCSPVAPGNRSRIAAETASSEISPVTVSDRATCSRLAPAFNRVIPTNADFAVLRVGSLYYARDPDQRRSTGVFTDSTFKVVMRLGAELPAPPARKRP